LEWPVRALCAAVLDGLCADVVVCAAVGIAAARSIAKAIANEL
jgi:hypothetical protein